MQRCSHAPVPKGGGAAAAAFARAVSPLLACQGRHFARWSSICSTSAALMSRRMRLGAAGMEQRDNGTNGGSEGLGGKASCATLCTSPDLRCRRHDVDGHEAQSPAALASSAFRAWFGLFGLSAREAGWGCCETVDRPGHCCCCRLGSHMSIRLA